MSATACCACRAPRPHEQGRADFSPPSGGQEWFQMVMQSMMKQYQRDFVHRARSDRFSPCDTAVPHRRRTSEHVLQQPVEHEGDTQHGIKAFPVPTIFSQSTFSHMGTRHICAPWSHVSSVSVSDHRGHQHKPAASNRGGYLCKAKACILFLKC